MIRFSAAALLLLVLQIAAVAQPCDSAAWVQQLPIPQRRRQTALVYDQARDRAVLFGGWATAADTWEWDGGAAGGGAWSRRLPVHSPSPRGEFGLVYDQVRGTTVLFGGRVSSNGPFLNDTWEWDGTDWTQAISTTVPSPRATQAFAYDQGRGRAVLFGGSIAGGSVMDTWEWDSATGQWLLRQPTSSPTVRTHAVLSYDAERGVTVLFGGLRSSNRLNDTWEWDGISGAWTQRFPPASPPGRINHRMTFDPNRRCVLLMGGDANSGSLSDLWEWQGVAGTWEPRPAAVTPPGRGGFGFAYDSARGQALVVGGTELPDTWKWDGAAWTQWSPGTAPPPRLDAASATDHSRGTVVVFGGEGQNARYSDTWEWNGSWTERTPGTSPSARIRASMAYCAGAGRVVLFGGLDTASFPAQYLAETWEWDGIAGTWTQRFPPVSPSPRYSAAMAPTTDGRVLLYGGYRAAAPPYLDDTWEWDSAAGTWTNVSPRGSPGHRAGAVMALDSRRGMTVLFGGSTNNTAPQQWLADTWEWDASTVRWRGVQPSGQPRGRVNAGLAFDPSIGRSLLFGGRDGSVGGSVRLNDTLLFDGAVWWRHQGVLPQERSSAAMAYAPGFGGTLLFGGFDGNPLGDTWLFRCACVANCDGSSAPPILNVNDFICFQTRFAAQDPAANCDGSTIPPVLNVNDFICFQSAFAAGCP